MTVKEAIEELKRYPEDAEVIDLKIEFINCKPGWVIRPKQEAVEPQ